MQSVKLFNRQEQRTAGYQNLAVDTFNANIRIAKLRMVFHALNGVLFGVENIAVIWLGATLLLDGGFSVGMLFAFISYKSQFTSRMSNLIDNAIDFKMLDVHRGRVADIALTEPEPEIAGTGLAPLGASARTSRCAISACVMPIRSRSYCVISICGSRQVNPSPSSGLLVAGRPHC